MEYWLGVLSGTPFLINSVIKRKEIFMSKSKVSEEILDHISDQEYSELVCEPSFVEETKQFKVCEDLSALDEFGY